ncbi:MAG: 16S rRNA (guanine(966)-N(2))-methyltransferase RsmD [Chlamydiota bacterium]|nr:16S rRNA (guanine(966)-N(2))-methyltransferase RsmD [Chlamydiota bacterium]
MIIIGGKYKGKRLFTPQGHNTRPTSSRLRETVFNIVQNRIEGASFLDLFAGSGAMGFEALSRGAARASFVDSDRNSATSIKKNANAIGVNNQVSTFSEDVLHYIEKLARSNQQFDIIYVDPPYEKNILYRGHRVMLSLLILQLVDTGNLLTPSGILFIEEGTKIENEVLNLKNLKFKRTKKSGRSFLHEYTTLENASN